MSELIDTRLIHRIRTLSIRIVTAKYDLFALILLASVDRFILNSMSCATSLNKLFTESCSNLCHFYHHHCTEQRPDRLQPRALN